MEFEVMRDSIWIDNDFWNDDDDDDANVYN